MADTIGQLRIYKTARKLEDEIYELVKLFPAKQYYGLGNDLRRSSAAVAHYIMETHRLYSYKLKMDALADVRHEAEIMIFKLENLKSSADISHFKDEYLSVIKQSWGLTKWLRTKLSDKQHSAEIEAKDQMGAVA